MWLASYYYNRAAEWGKSVTLNTEKAAYAPAGINTKTIGSAIDFEKIGDRSPSGIRTGTWDVDEPIGSTWGYTDGERFTGPASIVSKLVDTASKNGTLLLNLSPQADGTISQPQRDALLGVGRWLDVNGGAIYGTHSWTKFGEGGGRGAKGATVRFTVKGDDLYAIVVGPWPAGTVTIGSLGTSTSVVSGVSLVGADAPPKFTQDATGLKIALPPTPPCEFAYAFWVTGLKTNPSTVTADVNPIP